MSSPHLPWRRKQRIWIISLWIYVVTDLCSWTDALRSPEVRRAGSPGSQFVTTNRLAESDAPPGVDYESLLEKMHGDFGIRSDIVEAAGKEPEYRGAETLVVPLYIPEGAVPINLARIARSGTLEPADDIVDMKVSPSSDSVLIRRIGPVSTGRRILPPRRPVSRPPKRPRPIRLPIRRSDLIPPSHITTTTKTPLISPLLSRFGQRLNTPNSTPLIVGDLLSSHVLPLDDDDDEDTAKRSKKNELSKDSQFHSFPVTERNEELSSTSKTLTNLNETSTADVKSITTIKFPKRPLTTTTAAPETSTISSTTTTITSSSSAATTTTQSSSTKTTAATVTASKPAFSVTTSDSESSATLKPFSNVSKMPGIKDSETSTQSTMSDRRTVLFPKPVESILRSTSPDSSTTSTTKTSAPTTATTATTTTTTTTSPTTTTEKPSSTTMRSSPSSLRILPPWLKRSSSTLLSSTTATTPAAIETTSTTTASTTTQKPPIIRLRTTRRPIKLTTARPFTNEKSPFSSTSELPSVTTNISKPSLKVVPVRRTTTTSTTTTTTSTTEIPVTKSQTSEKSVKTTPSTTKEAITTPKQPQIVTERLALSSQRHSPLRMMVSVEEIFGESKTNETLNTTDKEKETVETTSTRNLFTTQSPVTFYKQKESTVVPTFVRSKNVSITPNSTDSIKKLSRPFLRFTVSDRKEQSSTPVSAETDASVSNPLTSDSHTEREESRLVNETTERPKQNDESTTKEAENKSTVTSSRKFYRHPRPAIHSNSKETGARIPEHRRPGRRRRPGRFRGTAPPPITSVSDFFKIPEETILYETANEEHITTTKTSLSTKPTIMVSATTFPTPVTTTEKSPEQVVIESLTEIMKAASNNNRGKDKVSSIATNLEALNKQLAEKGIHIIHAEVDGVRIKLDDRTFPRHTTPPTPTTFHPSSAFKVTLTPAITTTTERIPISLTFPLSESNSGFSEDEELKTTFTIHTLKPSDTENETDSENEVHSTTNDSSFTTFKPSEIKTLSNKPLRGETQSPVLSASMLPSSEDTDGGSSANVNTTPVNKNPETPTVDTTASSVRTSSSLGNREKEGEENGSVPSVAISASSTIPASVTTRTRSTTVHITTRRPTLRPTLFYPRDKTSRPAFSADEEVFSNTTVVIKSKIPEQAEELEYATSIHPTSHHRPTSLPKVPVGAVGPFANTTGESNYDAFSYATVVEDTPPTPSDTEVKSSLKTSTSTSTTRRPIIAVISITKELQDAPYSPESVAAAEDIGSKEFEETTSSASTTIYVIGVIGIIPAAGLAVFLARKFLRRSQKALPDSEERAEGFTPVTHHSRKPSHSNTLEVEPSSVEAKNPKYSPWEFPRTKLRLVSILGEGNFGVVWKAEARELSAYDGTRGATTVLVAVKGVKEGAGLKERQDLLKELAIMQHIGQHPNVVTLLGCCTQQEPHYLVMEYVMFGKLLTFLRDNRTRHNYFNFSSDTDALTSKDLTRFACQIATGCDYLQTRGIIHRDLAARNILVDHNKVCKIADFGLARNIKDIGSDIYEQKSRGALPIRWMAPESLYMSIFTHKSDVWSLGILCWEIVTLGSTPYPGMTAREVMRRVREGYRLERPEHCRPEFYHIVTKCWHQDLNKRPSFAELKFEMAQLLEHGHAAYPCIDLENFPEADYFSMHDNEDEKL